MVNKRKIFDITPPSPKIVKAAKESLPKKSSGARKKFRFKKPIFMTAGVLLVGVLCFIFIKPQAEIEIWPVKETMELTTQFSPVGELMTQTQLTSQDFAATGKAVKAEKAEGVVRIYNNYSLPQTLVQNTRLWCFEGDTLKEFKTKEKVVIPSQAQLDVPVAASSAGAEYNIGPCTFSIPGLKGSPRYTSVYGKSSLPMSGGIKTEATVVNQEDLHKAERVITEKALADSKLALKNFISPEDYVLLEDAIEANVIEAKPLAGVGQAVDNFTFQAKAEAKALVFKKVESVDFAKAYVQSKITRGKELVAGSLVLSYTLKSVDLVKREMVLDLRISAVVYSAFNETLVKEDVKNFGMNDVVSALNKFPEISRAQVRIWPFWSRIVPDDISRIKIKLRLD